MQVLVNYVYVLVRTIRVLPLTLSTHMWNSAPTWTVYARACSQVGRLVHKEAEYLHKGNMMLPGCPSVPCEVWSVIDMQ